MWILPALTGHLALLRGFLNGTPLQLAGIASSGGLPERRANAEQDDAGQQCGRHHNQSKTIVQLEYDDRRQYSQRDQLQKHSQQV